MTLDEYLEELTDSNWHTLRQLIELERSNAIGKQTDEVAYRAYLAARTITTN